MNHRISLRQFLPLAGITVSAFLFNTSEFMPIGLLTSIASDFQITEAQAGVMISAYSWAVTILSLPLMLLACKVEYRKLLLMTLGVFCLGQALSAFSSQYALLTASRICVACAHSVFWSIAAPMAVQLVEKEHRSTALSMVATGTSIAMILGLPLGRVIGLYIGWRMTFLTIGIISFLTLVYIWRVFPQIPSRSAFSVRQLPELVKNPVLIRLYGLTVVMATAYYTSYSYIEPFFAADCRYVGRVDYFDADSFRPQRIRRQRLVFARLRPFSLRNASPVVYLHGCAAIIAARGFRQLVCRHDIMRGPRHGCYDFQRIFPGRTNSAYVSQRGCRGDVYFFRHLQLGNRQRHLDWRHGFYVQFYCLYRLCRRRLGGCCVGVLYFQLYQTAETRVIAVKWMYKAGEQAGT